MVDLFLRFHYLFLHLHQHSAIENTCCAEHLNTLLFTFPVVILYQTYLDVCRTTEKIVMILPCWKLFATSCGASLPLKLFLVLSTKLNYIACCMLHLCTRMSRERLKTCCIEFILHANVRFALILIRIFYCI